MAASGPYKGEENSGLHQSPEANVRISQINGLVKWFDVGRGYGFIIPDNGMQDISIADFAGKTLILAVVPSLDTPTCSVQTKHFNQSAAALGDNIRILTVSLDLPFAQKRWCAAEGVNAVTTASDYKYRSFGESYGAFLPDLGLLARAVFVIGTDRKIKYAEYVSEVAAEPNYEAALTAAKSLI